ncbi:MAG TPA: response regulator [Candidatus Limnocylindrales bacterium]|nr:response regulator [Candidatus Limnocylindrales bacterium]
MGTAKMTARFRNSHLRDCVVLVDDEANIRETVAFILDAEGVEVATASDGIEGLAAVRRLRPKVVLLDVMMPKMDGYEVCRAIRQDANLMGMYVIILTAKGQRSDEQRAFETGADLYMSKPFDDEVVLKVIGEVFAGIPVS